MDSRCYTAHLALSALAPLCTLPASGPPRTLFFVVKKGIRFVLNPSSLLQAKQNVEKRAWMGQFRTVLELCRGAGFGPTRCGRIHSRAFRGSCLLSRDGIETCCVITELDSINACPGPMVFFWQRNRALQGSAFSSQGKST